jgi:hypothetical protein
MIEASQKDNAASHKTESDAGIKTGRRFLRHRATFCDVIRSIADTRF